MFHLTVLYTPPAQVSADSLHTYMLCVQVLYLCQLIHKAPRVQGQDHATTTCNYREQGWERYKQR